jgi:hypothetical protein
LEAVFVKSAFLDPRFIFWVADGDFPPSFESLVKKILRLLFHVIAHLYHGHFKEIVMLNLHSHLNCLFAHLILFNDRYRMIDDKETEVLADLVVALRLRDDAPPPPPPVPAPELLEDDKENCDTFCNMDAATGAVGGGGGGGSNNGSSHGSTGSGAICAGVAKMDTSDSPPPDSAILADSPENL